MKHLSKNVLIKTYTFESGLWYLAESLAKELKDSGRTVRFVPKSKYIKVNNSFKRTYFPSTVKTEFEILPMNNLDNVGSQISKYLDYYRIGDVISFETLLEGSIWVKNLRKRNGVNIIDVPMLEWVTPTIFYNKGYSQFDEIWAVNDLTYQAFVKEKYYRTKKVSWDFTPNYSLVAEKSYDKNEIIFYHQSTINPAFSHKNTVNVIKAFILFNNIYSNSRLNISGLLNEAEITLAKTCLNIHYNNEVLPRNEIDKEYEKAYCVVAPSLKEGLGLSLFEAKKFKCKLITSDMAPMNEHADAYLCEVSNLRKDHTLVPKCEVDDQSILKQMIEVYKEYVRESSS